MKIIHVAETWSWVSLNYLSNYELENLYPPISPWSGLWIKFEMDNESLEAPVASPTSSTSSVNFLSTSDVSSDVPKCLTTFITTAGEYIYLKLWIVSKIKEKEVPTLQWCQATQNRNLQTPYRSGAKHQKIVKKKESSPEESGNLHISGVHTVKMASMMVNSLAPTKSLTTYTTSVQDWYNVNPSIWAEDGYAPKVQSILMPTKPPKNER